MVGPAASEGRRRHWRLLEREAELELIDGLLADCDESGVALLMEGPAGIGKTRVLDAARAKATERGFQVLAARAVPLEREFPFGVVRQLLAGELIAASEETREQLLAGTAGGARFLLDPAGGQGTVSADSLAVAHHALYWLCVNLAQEGPLLLAIDDTHWADEPSLGWLDFMSRRLEGLPILLAAARRTAEPGVEAGALDALADDSRTARLTPGALSEEAVAELVSAELAAPVEPAFASACHAATRGNPMLLRELLTAHAAEGGDATAAGAPRVLELSSMGVARSVLARLERLPAAARELTTAVAVLGDGTELPLAAELAGIDERTASELAHALASCQVLEAERPLSFVHPLVRASVYDAEPPFRRADAHARAARLLERRVPIDELGTHLLACEPRRDGWVAQTLIELGERALGRGALRAAAAYLRRALAEPPPAAAEARALLALGSVEAALGVPEAGDRLRAAVDAAGSPQERATVALEVGRALALFERPVAAVEACERGLEELGDADRELALRLQADALGAAHSSFAARRAARRILARWTEADPPAGDTPAERLLLASLSWERAATLTASADEVIALARRALAGGALLKDATAASPSFHVGVNALLLSDSLAEGEAHYDAALREAATERSPRVFAVASSFRSWIRYRMGALPGAEADARAALDVAQEHGWEILAPCPLAIATECLVERGQLDEARALLERWRRVPEGRDATQVGGLLVSRGRVRGLSGDVAGALEDMTACGELHSEWINPGFASWRSLVAYIRLRLGDADEARRLVYEELELARRYGAPLALGVALRVAGFLERGPKGMALLEDAVEVLESSEVALELARTRRSLGVALTKAGREKAGRDVLRRALDGAHRCGATELAEASRRSLVAAGGRPRRFALSGLESLTPSERRAARLAAQGLTNREIAEHQFLTLRTVEIHLTHAYRKLGIASRDELPAAALGAEPDACAG